MAGAVHTAAFAAIMICWLVFAAGFLLRPRAQAAPERARDRRSLAGGLLQGVAFAIVGSVGRDPAAPLLRFGGAGEEALAGAAAVLAGISVCVAVAAVRTLGRQWSLAARLIEGHRLVTEGPYRLVRHPIYTAMLGMLVATGVVRSTWSALLVAVTVYVVGTAIRVRTEEKLLRSAFGPEFESYVRRVPAILPGRIRPAHAGAGPEDWP